MSTRATSWSSGSFAKPAAAIACRLDCALDDHLCGVAMYRTLGVGKQKPQMAWPTTAATCGLGLFYKGVCQVIAVSPPQSSNPPSLPTQQVRLCPGSKHVLLAFACTRKLQFQHAKEARCGKPALLITCPHATGVDEITDAARLQATPVSTPLQLAKQSQRPPQALQAPPLLSARHHCVRMEQAAPAATRRVLPRRFEML